MRLLLITFLTFLTFFTSSTVEATSISTESSSASKIKYVGGWTIRQVKDWVLHHGEIFKSDAETLEKYEVDGGNLMTMTLTNLKSICGEGLTTEKLWVEIQKFQETSRGSKSNVEDFVGVSASSTTSQNGSGQSAIVVVYSCVLLLGAFFAITLAKFHFCRPYSSKLQITEDLYEGLMVDIMDEV